MNPTSALPECRSASNRRRLNLLGAALLALALAGCGNQSSTTEAPADIRGEPISASPQTNRIEPVLMEQAAANKPASQPAASPAAGQGSKEDGYQTVGFDKLAGFNFEITDTLLNPQTNQPATTVTTDGQIPAAVKELDKKRVALQGFMLPLKVEGGTVTELLIMKDQSMCCYGAVPKINEWVSVKMIKGGIRPLMDQPVTLFGTLHVGEMRENGYLVGIYNLDGEKMTGPAEN